MAHYTKADLEKFFDAYVEAALFSSNDESDDPLDEHYSASDLSQKAEDKMIADCKRFLDQAWPLIEEAPRLIAGHGKVAVAGGDFWFTRNGHGVGFWAGEWPEEIGEKLSKLSKRFGSMDIVVGDDGCLHV